MRKDILIYVAHPYSGKKENEEKVAKIISTLESNIELGKVIIDEFRGTYTAFNDYSEINLVFISPIHAFGRNYTEIDYLLGIKKCIALLNKCDILLIPKFKNMETSKGCLIELGTALGTDKKIIYLENLLEEYK